MSLTIELNLTSGEFILNAGESILIPGVPLTGISAIKADPDYRFSDMKNGFAWHSFCAQFLNKRYVFGLCEYHGCFYSMHWQLPISGSDVCQAWPDQDTSLLQKQMMIDDLASIIPNYNGEHEFEWGIVWSVFYAKGGFASSGTSYIACKQPGP